MYFYALQTEWLIHPTSFLNAVQKRAERTQGFYPSWKREAAWKSQLAAFSWWLFASCSAYRRYVSIQQNMKTPPDLRTPLSSHDMSSPEVGQTSKCLLCLPLQCSQSISEGEAVQQWGLLSGTVFPAAHRPKGSRTWKQRLSCGRDSF